MSHHMQCKNASAIHWVINGLIDWDHCGVLVVLDPVYCNCFSALLMITLKVIRCVSTCSAKMQVQWIDLLGPLWGVTYIVICDV
jgi:hypothetical protein